MFGEQQNHVQYRPSNRLNHSRDQMFVNLTNLTLSLISIIGSFQFLKTQKEAICAPICSTYFSLAVLFFTLLYIEKYILMFYYRLDIHTIYFNHIHLLPQPLPGYSPSPFSLPASIFCFLHCL